jgi:ABC-2 type transport system permease protein
MGTHAGGDGGLGSGGCDPHPPDIRQELSMFGRIFFIARNEIAFFFRTRETYVWAFVMPVLFIYFIGTVTSQFGGRGRSADDPIPVEAPKSAGFLADQIVLRLEENGLAADRQDTDAPDGTDDAAPRRLVIPENLTASVLGGKPSVVTLFHSGEGLANDFDQFRVARAVYTVLADLITCDASGKQPDAAAFQKIHEIPRALVLDVRSAGTRLTPPTGFEQAVPGMMIMFTMISLLSVGSVTLVIERRQGRLKRLASAPISRGELLTGKWAGRMFLGVVQMAFAMFTGSLLFGMRWGQELPSVVLVLLAFAALCGWASVLLGNLARSEAQSIGLGVLLTNVIAALGGLWWPIEICPPWMQSLAACLPTGWTMHAMHQLVSFHAGPGAAVAPLAALLVAAAITGGLAVRTFRYQ